jgi:hypothetical protein
MNRHGKLTGSAWLGHTAERLGHLSLSVIGLQSAYVGLWAAAAPRSFTRKFPGFGLHWIDPTAGSDEHFVRDVGLLQLAMLVLVSLAFRDPGLRRVTGIVWSVFAVPHLAYHASHTAGLDPWAAAASLTALAASVVAGLFLIIVGSIAPVRPNRRRLAEGSTT